MQQDVVPNITNRIDNAASYLCVKLMALEDVALDLRNIAPSDMTISERA